MVANYLGTIAFIFILWLMGQLLLKLGTFSQLPYKNLHFISIPLGIPVCVLIADLLYLRIGTSVGMIRIAYAVLAVTAILVLAKKGIKREEIIGLIGMYVIFHIMLLPALLNGVKYYVHRGNIYDHYFYLSEVIYMGLHKLKDALSLPNMNDVLTFGYGAVNSDRPTVPLLCAVLTAKGWGNVFFQAHLFLLVVWMGAFGSLMLALEMFSGKLKKPLSQNKCMLLSLLYVWGFFGQIQYDINAWSQLAALGALLAYVCIFLIVLEKYLGTQIISRRDYLVLILLGTGLFLLYPENTLLQGALLAIASILIFVLGKRKISMKTFCSIAVIPILILIAAAFLHSGTVRFALIQVQSSGSDVRQSWAAYFDAYWLGAYPMPNASPLKTVMKKLIAFVPSLFGMYILAPDFGNPVRMVRWTWIALAACLALGLLLLLAKCFPKIVRSLWDETEYHKGFLGLFAYIGIAVFLCMMLMGKYWSAGKLFLYLSPYIYLVLIYPLLEDKTEGERQMRKKKLKSIGRKLSHYGVLITSFTFLLCQAVFVGLRVKDAIVNKDCTGYLNGYPSDQYPGLKQDFPYEFEAKKYKNEDMVAIQIEDGWYQDYVELSLAYEDISYYAVPDMVFNRGVMKEIQPELGTEVTITVMDTYRDNPD